MAIKLFPALVAYGRHSMCIVAFWLHSWTLIARNERDVSLGLFCLEIPKNSRKILGLLRCTTSLGEIRENVQVEDRGRLGAKMNFVKIVSRNIGHQTCLAEMV